jgi:hypothetical protein
MSLVQWTGENCMGRPPLEFVLQRGGGVYILKNDA